MNEPATAAKRGRPSDAERHERRKLILDVAVKLLADQGYARTTIEQIAAESHVTKRTVYAYFGDKPDVFVAAVERLHRQVAAGASGEGSPETLLDLAARIVRTLYSAEAVSLHRMVIAEATHFPELASAFYSSGPQLYIDLLSDRLDHERRAQAESLFTLLLGEPHRRRLLGLMEAPTAAEARQHAGDALAALGMILDEA